jgi:hypothetical protein
VEKEDGLSAEQWTVGSLIFLRGIVPAITALASSPQTTSCEKKGFILIGKFLMKLCCKSLHKPTEGFLNEVMQQSIPLFDEFCRQIIAIGATKKNLPRPLSSIDISDVGLTELYDFLSIVSADIMSALSVSVEKEGVNELGKIENFFSRFKNEISLSLVDVCSLSRMLESTKLLSQNRGQSPFGE